MFRYLLICTLSLIPAAIFAAEIEDKTATPLAADTKPGESSVSAPRLYPSDQKDLPVMPMPDAQVPGGSTTAANTAKEAKAPVSGKNMAIEGSDKPTLVMPEHYEIYFENNSISLNAAARQVIRNAADDFGQLHPRKVIISGNTDRSGSLQHNRELADKRGRIVAKLLIKYGVPEEMLDIRSYGASAAWVDQVPGNKDSRYRNVKIFFIKNTL